MNSKEMELILSLSSNMIVENYDKDFYQGVIDIIREYFQAESCFWCKSNRKDDCVINDIDLLIENKKDSIIVINLDTYNYQESFIIKNPNLYENLNSSLFSWLKIFLENISKNHTMINALKEQIYIDGLTGVYNNKALLDLIEFKKYFSKVGVCFVDANGLGILNNTYGHKEGDRLLKTVSSCIEVFFRKKDIYRRSGDEFLIISENIDEDLFMKKIDSIKQSLLLTGYSASFGCVYQDSCKDLLSMIEIAEQNMYAEKEKFRKNNPSKYEIKKIRK